MSFFEKLDELIEKLDTPEKELSEVENNTQNDIIEEAPIVEDATQEEKPEDAKANETIEKLSNIVLKQNEQIDSLKKQMAQLVNYGGAQINDGANIEPTQQPSSEPEPYEALADLDYSIKY